MIQKKSLQQREKELQALLSSPQGRAELESLAEEYRSRSGRPQPVRRSLITYILVHERQAGLIN
jgi:hypothetical protein